MQLIPQTERIFLGASSKLLRFARVAHLLIAATLCSLCAMAQIPSQAHHPIQLPPNEAGLLVWVTDPSGAVVQNAHVTIVNPESHTTIDGLTDMHGVFKARGLRAETYSITASSPGFQESQTTLDFTLGLLRETGVSLNSLQRTVVFLDNSPFPIQAEPRHIPVGSASVSSERALKWILVDPLPPQSQQDSH